MSTWRERAALLTERYPTPDDQWEQSFLHEAVRAGTALGQWLGKTRATVPEYEQELIDHCLAELRMIVKRLDTAAKAGELWLTAPDPLPNVDAAQTTLVSLDLLMGCIDLFRDLRRDVENYQQAPGWPKLPDMLFDRGRLTDALQYFRYEWSQGDGGYRFVARKGAA